MQTQFIQLFFLLGHGPVCLIIQLDCFILTIILAIQLLPIQDVTVAVVVDIIVFAVVVVVAVKVLQYSYYFDVVMFDVK